nr:immunoglobulin light chain junction region [Macaca mulatta]MOV74351.1 immunoglobulin light chain junction region [Macaca mulatta]MOV74398.1 immunoglobulin light chain junction region [Macaca mulatta]MOV74881.1 immunoglobulin light chain junction region [Macaca mulatta]MOV75301.1 immunoglobulin light chain junction region [Macaca mulatta]
CQQYNDLITF